MSELECKPCSYKTKRKEHFARHLKSSLHCKLDFLFDNDHVTENDLNVETRAINEEIQSSQVPLVHGQNSIVNSITDHQTYASQQDCPDENEEFVSDEREEIFDNSQHSSDWLPFASKAECLLYIFMNSTTHPVSDGVVSYVLFMMQQLGINNLPTLQQLKDKKFGKYSWENMIMKGNSNENIPVWIVKPSEIMKLSIANPEIAKKLVRQPKKQAMIEHPANASKWLEMGEEIENIHQLPSVKIPIKLFLDDTSAHKSKRWLALHCIQMQLSGIPLAEMQRQGNVHFVGATEKAEIMDIASVVIEDMREVQLNGIKSYDAKNKEPCLVKSCIDTVVADYAMMSYCCNHLGATATKYCPRCYADSDHYMTIGRKRSPRDTQFQLQRLNIRSGEKTKREFRKKKGIKEHKNVFWNELDPHNDIPIGMLHLIPLGLAKHLVKFIVDHSSEDIKSRMEYHLKDLYPDTCRFNNFFKYMDSRQGKDFKDYLQVATFNMMYAGVPRQYVKLVACLATIQKLLSNWQFSEEDIEIVRETIRIYHHLIHQYAPELKKKAKTHLLLHVVDDIRRHGPPKAYAEDAFEKNHGTIRNMIFLQNQKARSRDTATKFAKQFLCQHILSGGYYETEQKWDCAASQVVMVGKQPSVQAFMGNSTVSEERPKSRPGTISLFKRQTNKKPVKEHMSEDVILQALLCVNVQDHHFDNYNIKRGSAVRAKDGKLVHTGEWISYMNNDQEECIGVLKEGMVIIPKRGAQLQVIVVTKCRKMNGVNVMGCMMMEKTGVTDIVPSRCVLTCLSVLHNCASAKCRIITTVQSRQIEQESVNQPSKHIKHNLDFNEFVINRFSL